METPFYADGLRFSCTRCSRCCRHDPGYVFLSRADLDALAAGTGLKEEKFIETCCRKVETGGHIRLSLKEKPNYDCIFWEAGGCRVYGYRPFQCRSYPFWHSNLGSPRQWKVLGSECPGVGTGELHSREEIEAWLDGREPLLDLTEDPSDR